MPPETAASTSAVVLELTGPLERIVGSSEVTIASEPQDRLGRVIGRFVQQHPEASPFLAESPFFDQPEGAFPPGVLVIRNGAAIAPRLETAVASGERLTLMPMISGG